MDALLRLGGVDDAARGESRRRARALIDHAAGRRSGPAVYAQVASAASGRLDDDLDALVAPGLAGVFLEDCAGRADVQQLALRLAVREAAAGLPAGAVTIVALAARAPGAVFTLGGYAGASPRLAGMAMDETELPGGAPARAIAGTLLALGAAAAGVPALRPARSAAGSPADAILSARAEGFGGFLLLAEADVDAFAGE